MSWLRFLQSVKLNGALCDSMGLGKTLQALLAIGLAHSDAEEENLVSIVVCPSSVVGHWTREVDRFFGDDGIFRVTAMMGSASLRESQWRTRHEKCNLIITSYAAIRKDIGMLEATRWRFCILDEGHLLKNPRTGKCPICDVVLSVACTFLSVALSGSRCRSQSDRPSNQKTS